MKFHDNKFYMVDTIVMKIEYPDFKVNNPDLFNPEFPIRTEDEIPHDLLYKPRKLFKKYVQNASKEDKDEGIYKPSLTAYRNYNTETRKLEYTLHIQFSAPKLLNSNNVEELSEKDLSRLVSTLQSKLKTMGIYVTIDVLSNAEVTKLHIGKNIEIKAPMTTTDVIAELKKADIGKQMEVNERDYKNGGESLYFYNGSRNHIFYDKVKDLGKAKVVSSDKDKTTYEKRLGRKLEEEKRQILRFETRFTNLMLLRKTVNKTLRQNQEKITLQSVFNEKLWRDCLIHEWHDVIDRPANQLAFKTSISAEDVLNIMIARQIESKNTVHSLNKVLIGFGLYYIISQLGVKKLKHKLSTSWNEKTYGDRLDEKIKDAAADLRDVAISEHLSVIERALQEFKQFKVNHDKSLFDGE